MQQNASHLGTPHMLLVQRRRQVQELRSPSSKRQEASQRQDIEPRARIERAAAFCLSALAFDRAR
eukprot:6184907-Pleurochrysis_carterae.AAC.3